MGKELQKKGLIAVVMSLAGIIVYIAWRFEFRFGVAATIARSEANLKVISDFVATNEWIAFLAKDPATRSNTSVCLSLKLSDDQVKQVVKLLEAEGVAMDIGAYKDAPAGIRIWCGATVESSDLQALMPWLSWAYQKVLA